MALIQLVALGLGAIAPLGGSRTRPSAAAVDQDGDALPARFLHGLSLFAP